MAGETVGRIMHRGVVTCSPATSVEDAVRILSDSDVPALVVVGNAGEMLGMLTHLDVLARYGEDLRERQVGEIMSPAVLSVEADAPVQAAIAMILNSRSQRLVVTAPGAAGPAPVGMLSTTDIIRYLRGAPSVWRWE